MKAIDRRTGKRIVGTSDTVLCCAWINPDSFEKNPDGSLEFDFDGETKIYYDTQEQITGPDRVRMFQDEDANDVPETEIVLVE